MNIFCGLFDPLETTSASGKEILVRKMLRQTPELEQYNITISEDGQCAFALSLNETSAITYCEVGTCLYAYTNPADPKTFFTLLKDALPHRPDLLDGSFALAAYSPDRGTTIFSDFFGTYPIYWCEIKNTFFFSTSLRSLWELPDFEAIIDIDAIAEYLAFGFIAAPRTIYSSVKKIPPAHYLQFSGPSPELRRYQAFTPGFPLPDTRSCEEQAAYLETLVTAKGAAPCFTPQATTVSGGNALCSRLNDIGKTVNEPNIRIFELPATYSPPEEGSEKVCLSPVGCAELFACEKEKPHIFDENSIRELLSYIPTGYTEKVERLRVSQANAGWLHPAQVRRRAAVETQLPALLQAAADEAAARQESWLFPFLSSSIARFAETLPVDSVLDAEGQSPILKILGYEAPVPFQALPEVKEEDAIATLEKIFSPHGMRLIREASERFTEQQLLTLYTLAAYLQNAPFEGVSSSPETIAVNFGPVTETALQYTLQAACKHLNTPIICFAVSGFHISHALSDINGPVVTKEAQSWVKDTLNFDWEQKTDWSCLMPHVKPDTVACFSDGMIPDYALRKKLSNINIDRVLIFEDGKTYLLPTQIPTWRERLRNMWILHKLAREKS